MVGNALVLSIGIALALVVRRTNYSIPGAFSDIFMMGSYQKLAAVLVSIGAFSLVNIWGYEPCPT
ncbi:MAG: hypothetical protein JRI70_00400 [Deltaproteobacteria bacterium]|nr:hypothetical protein [Deltaproteobacteria bacterium]MBW2171049.1 hypothetical protein [Deltaproteobacteria bacterium]MBW2259406.1 hypothetical protein [Deltaproteobacteria bacterium]